MEESSLELNLLEPEELAMLDAVWNLLPESDRAGISKENVLFVLDTLDDYMLDKGLAVEDPKTGEILYLDGDVDETEELDYILGEAKKNHRDLSSSQVQLILDAEMQYGLAQGYYEEEV